MQTPLVGLEEVEQPLAARDWARVRQLLETAAAGPDADPAVLDLHAEACWWLGDLETCISQRERAHELQQRNGDLVNAARTAMLIADDHDMRGRHSVAGSWLRRAARLLEEEPPCLQHGCLLLRQGEAAHGAGELERAAACFDEAVRVARRFGDVDLEADGLQATGRLLISQSLTAEGLAHLDEAMLLGAEGRLSPFMTGKVYCSLVSACEEMGDLGRAAEWASAGSRWAAAEGAAVFPGLCRVHHAEVLQRRGAWAEAELEAERACTELASVQVYSAALAYCELGEIRRRRGDLAGAETAFEQAESLGHAPQPGLALLRLSQGRTPAAARGIERALIVTGDDPLARARLLPANVQITLALDDREAASTATAELAATAAAWQSPLLTAEAASARARVELAGRRGQDACASAAEARRRWLDLGVPYEVASCDVLLGLAHLTCDDAEGARARFRLAAEAFSALGAAPDAAEATRLAAGGRSPASAATSLTARECDVLRLVAAGQTNREVATALGLSVKTVARHLSNIFTKIDVSTRSAATAYAYSHGLVDL